jgi:CRISPR-associated protein Cas2
MMLVLVTYDVSTTSERGRKRLRKVAECCLDYGQRVQNSVFECTVNQEQWARLRLRLLDLINPDEDSVRFYFMGNNWRRRVEHHGTKPSMDLEGPLIA